MKERWLSSSLTHTHSYQPEYSRMEIFTGSLKTTLNLGALSMGFSVPATFNREAQGHGHNCLRARSLTFWSHNQPPEDGAASGMC